MRQDVDEEAQFSAVGHRVPRMIHGRKAVQIGEARRMGVEIIGKPSVKSKSCKKRCAIEDGHQVRSLE